MAELKEEIREKAVELFQKEGFAFRLDEIAKELHISKKTIYQYYGGKEDIFRSFIIDSFASVHDFQEKIYNDSSLSTIEKLREILNARSKYEDSLAIEKTMGLKDVYPNCYKLILESYTTQWEKVTQLLEQGEKEGIFRKDLNIVLVENLLMEGMQMMHRDDVLAKTGLSYREAIEEVVSLVLEGIEVRK